MQVQPYRARRPRVSPLWQCLSRHFDAFLESYESHYRHDYGHLRPIIPEVVGKFMGCGDYSRGFARVRCDHCTHEYLLPFSCKGRWFCPSCHQKKKQLEILRTAWSAQRLLGFHKNPLLQAGEKMATH